HPQAQAALANFLSSSSMVSPDVNIQAQRAKPPSEAESTSLQGFVLLARGLPSPREEGKIITELIF
ncbi:MAG: hypothetical protein ACLFTI_11480, partial [Anaerolineales bacterium]